MHVDLDAGPKHFVFFSCFCNLWCDIFISNSLNFCCQSCLRWIVATAQVYLRYCQKRPTSILSYTARPGNNKNYDKTTNMHCGSSGMKDKGGKRNSPILIDANVQHDCQQTARAAKVICKRNEKCLLHEQDMRCLTPTTLRRSGCV